MRREGAAEYNCRDQKLTYEIVTCETKEGVLFFLYSVSYDGPLFDFYYFFAVAVGLSQTCHGICYPSVRFGPFVFGPCVSQNTATLQHYRVSSLLQVLLQNHYILFCLLSSLRPAFLITGETRYIGCSKDLHSTPTANILGFFRWQALWGRSRKAFSEYSLKSAWRKRAWW